MNPTDIRYARNTGAGGSLGDGVPDNVITTAAGDPVTTATDDYVVSAGA